QVDVQGTIPPRSLGYWVDAYSMTPASIVHATSARGCGGDLGASLYVGGIYDLELRGAPPGAAAWFLVGEEQTRLADGTVLPSDVPALGMRGCGLGVDPLVVLAATTDGAGTARLRLQLPPLSRAYSVVHVQAAHRAGNAAGLATSNVLHAIFGHAEIST